MNSISLSRHRAMRLKIWQPLAINAMAFLIAAAFIVTSRWSDKQYTPDLAQDIPGLTIEQQPAGVHHQGKELIVTSVKSQGMAHEVGVEVGDVITSVDGQAVVSKRQLDDVIAANALPVVHLALRRGLAPVALDLPVADYPAK